MGPDAAEFTGDAELADAEAVGDLLDGTSAESRARKRLELRTAGNRALVVIRPHDHRVLEARVAK
jgi:hypothetical protein